MNESIFLFEWIWWAFGYGNSQETERLTCERWRNCLGMNVNLDHWSPGRRDFCDFWIWTLQLLPKKKTFFLGNSIWCVTWMFVLVFLMMWKWFWPRVDGMTWIVMCVLWCWCCCSVQPDWFCSRNSLPGWTDTNVCLPWKRSESGIISTDNSSLSRLLGQWYTAACMNGTNRN